MPLETIARENSSSQDPPLSFVAPSEVRVLLAGIGNFYIYWLFDRRASFELQVPFRGALLGRQLRAAIAEARGEEAAALELQQYRARRKRDGRPVVEVAGGYYADEQGEKVARGQCEGAAWHVICDEEAVPTAGELRAVIDVYKKK